ncbi:GMC family oxidoreductase [Amycolatopsis sp. NPDC005232]|uniref:GMC family oxidoreductase n=1 Tax=Amycolatopsis sp. NPDC005232 TaxID=3157027 RepID=UPI0033A1CE9A
MADTCARTSRRGRGPRDRGQERGLTRHAGPHWHMTGTARMGSGALSVVDPGLAVQGVGNLFVVDASVMPTIPRANTHATTIAIAERAAELLPWRSRDSRQWVPAAPRT